MGSMGTWVLGSGEAKVGAGRGSAWVKFTGLSEYDKELPRTSQAYLGERPTRLAKYYFPSSFDVGLWSAVDSLKPK